MIQCTDKFFNKTKNIATLLLMSETHLPCLSKVILKVRYNGDIQKGQANIATIRLDQSCLFTGGPVLINIKENNLCYMEVKNCSPVKRQDWSNLIVAMFACPF